MRPFTLLVKPASADCNLRCEYCFYLEKSRLYPGSKHHRMSAAVLERMIEGYMATKQPAYTFGWQGGEPMLMGLDFFRKITELQQKYGRAGDVVSNGLQTNATLIDDETARHLRSYRFLVGCSLDGPAEIHDRYRRSIGGAASHADVLRGIDVLRRHKVEFNILVLVSRSNVHRAPEVYRYLTDQGFLHQQYVPCVEFDREGTLRSFAIDGPEWGDFLCELFDQWYREDAFRVSIRHFDAVLAKMVDGATNVCSMGRDCCQYFVVEHNGDIYPCDFFVREELRLGNVMQTSWKEALASSTYRDFGSQKSQWNEACKTCDCLDLCAGDCLKHRIEAGGSPRTLSRLCTGWKQFFRHTRERFDQLAETVRTRRIEEQRITSHSLVQTNRPLSSAGRNAPCPCGSGRKFKKCCGR